MRRRAGIGLTAVAVLTGLSVAYLVVPGRFDGDALLMSLRRHSAASGIYCTRTGHGEDRSCQFVVGSDSTGPQYDVTVDGRCWAAHRADGGTGAEGIVEGMASQPDEYEGCIVLGDDLRPLGRFLYGSGLDDIQPYPSPDSPASPR